MTFETIEVSKQDRIGLLVFNRPDSLNAFNSKMKREVSEGLASLMDDPEVLVVVVCGNGRAFSAGFDLKEKQPGGPTTGNEAWGQRLAVSFQFIMQFWDAPKPVVAATHGYCLAGAFELAMACDIIVAEEGTRFGEPEVRFGSGIVAMILPWMTSTKIATEILLTGDDRVDAVAAKEMGIVNSVVPKGQGREKAMEYARKIASADPQAVRLTRKAIQRSLDIAGMRQALEASLDIDVLIEGAASPKKQEFNKIREEKGLNAAIAWRDAQFK